MIRWSALEADLTITAGAATVRPTGLALAFFQEVPVLRLPVLLALPLAFAASIQAQNSPAPAARDTLDAATYDGWKQYSLICARCHGDDGLGTSFGPNLVTSLRPDGTIPSREAFLALLASGRPDKGMPSAAALGLEQKYFDGLYAYLSGRSAGRYHGGRPALKGP